MIHVLVQVCEVEALYSVTEGALYHHISLINHRFPLHVVDTSTCVSPYLISVAAQMLSGVGLRESSGKKR